MSVRLPTVHQRTPTQSRCYILDNIHGGLTRGALALGESLPACAWRFPLHARSPNHGGLTPAALASECERLPAKLRLLRCTNAHAPGAGGVSPPWFTATQLQRRGAIVRETSAPHTGERQRSHGTATPTAGSRPPLLCWNANVCRRNCHFCDGRTRVHQERGASASRGSRQRTCSGVAQLFGRHPPHTLASASAVTVPPHPRWADAAILRWVNRRLLVRGDFPCTRVLLTTAGSRPPLLRRANRCLLVRGDFFCTRVLGTTAGSRPPLLSPANRRLLVRCDFSCTRVLLTTAGSRPPLLCWNANVCRRNCHFCDARMHGEQKRGANA
jgi:hypothetical protein